MSTHNLPPIPLWERYVMSENRAQGYRDEIGRLRRHLAWAERIALILAVVLALVVLAILSRWHW